MASFWRDIRFGIRMLRKAPGHSAAAAIALSLGIGLTTAMFSIVYGAIYRGLPYDHSERLMSLSAEMPARDRLNESVDVHDFLDWRRRQTSFEGLLGYTNGTMTLSGDAQPERLDGASLTANALQLLRVKPLLGRGFAAGDDRPGAAPVVLLGYRLWKDRYNGDPAIVGRGVRVNGQQSLVVGIMPADFRFPFREQIWLPQILDPAKTERGKGDSLEVIGRLRAGATADQAGAELAAISQSIAREYPRSNAGWSASVLPVTDRFLGKPLRLLLLTMLGAVSGVLLIACINVASLVMSRASQRSREIAIRSALGAGRHQVIRQILTESLLLSILGATLGLALAWEGVTLFNRAIQDQNPPAWLHIGVDLPALLFTLAVTVAAAVVAGLLPAMQVSRAQLNDVLKDEGRSSTSLRLGWLSRAVVIAELALSCVLLVASGLMVRTIVRAQTTPLGFDTAHLLTFRVPLFESNFPKPADRAAFYQRLVDRLAEQPGVQAVGATTSIPSISSDIEAFAVDGRAYATNSDYPQAHYDVVSAGFFTAAGARPLEGREINRFDTQTAQPVVVINRSLARQIWPHQSALGKRLRLPLQKDETWRTVVGVMPDVRLYGQDDIKPAGLFLPLAQAGPERLSIIIRTSQDPLALVGMARRQVAALDRDTPIYFVKTMTAAVAEDRFFRSLFGSMFCLFGAIALVLATVGVYGVIAFSVQRRTSEIGLRLALGARRGEIVGMLLRQGALQLGIGLMLGLPAAFALSRLLATTQLQVDAADPGVFLAVTAGLALVALIACLVPGRRAADIDPLAALRTD